MWKWKFQKLVTIYKSKTLYIWMSLEFLIIVVLFFKYLVYLKSWFFLNLLYLVNMFFFIDCWYCYWIDSYLCYFISLAFKDRRACSCETKYRGYFAGWEKLWNQYELLIMKMIEISCPQSLVYSKKLLEFMIIEWVRIPE